ncbi:threonine ammonia-lyase [Heliophilum fasciatum]|uniref:L-threonine dehydratase catabolic TdcB n=1 Tax=Heliophilum fasciatum TaxID=35700 RepID=A0A4R2RZA1_9FIRM|nr:threonine ammonia-lyase [Heliophilum fasciatum]MCW2277157.1 threonine dehydratase [Heliophilum fasciatum]TCP68207.1 threonine dehydratase [Heliophilum fasciatum]
MKRTEASLSLAMIETAAQRIAPYIHRTPLAHSHTFSRLAGCEVYLKCENWQRTGSFKLRGALNRLLSLTEDEKKLGVVAASAGNHAQGVALAATMVGVPATIVMPKGAALAKIEATRGYGAEVILEGDTYDEAYQAALALQKERSLLYVHAFDDPLVIAGQGTVGLEIADQLPDITGITVPIGGGGLIAGLALALKSRFPQVRIIGVQSTAASAMVASRQAGCATTVSCQRTIADGIRVALPGRLTFPLVQDLVDDLLTVDDEAIAKAIVLLLERAKLVVEGAGAVSLAALLTQQLGKSGERWVALLSGGNTDISAIAALIEHGLVQSGRRWEFRVTLTDAPGSLQQLLALIAAGGANVISIIHDRLAPTLSLRQVEVIIALETRDHEHIDELTVQLTRAGFLLRPW